MKRKRNVQSSQLGDEERQIEMVWAYKDDDGDCSGETRRKGCRKT